MCHFHRRNGEKSGNIKCSGQISTRLDALLKKHHLFPPNNDPTDIWWDLENCLPPTDVKEESIYGRMKRALRLRNYTGKINIRALFAYEDSDQIPLEMQRKLQASKIGIRNLGFIKSNNENQHPKPAPDAADDAIKLEIDDWISIDENAPPRNIMIISGDHKGFEMKLKELSDLKYRTLAVFRPGGSNQEKINPHVFDSWFLRDFLSLPEQQGKRKFYGTLKGFKDSSEEDEEEIQKKRAKKNERLEKPTENYTDIGGLKNQIKELVEAIVSPIKGKSKVLDDDRSPKGVLLSGPPGTGKTLMARACAAQINASFLKLDGPQLVQPDGSKQILREAFELAKENAPCIIFIDKIDAIATTRVTKGRNAQKTLVELFNQLRELGHNDLVKVIATTNHADILRQELIHAKRLDRKIEIPLPTEEARADILQIHSREMNVKPDVKFEELARSTDGFNGAQLKAVCVEAGMLAATDVVNRENFNESIIQVQGKKGKPGDLVGVNKDSYSMVKAKEVDEKATKNYTDIGGLKNQIQELVQAIGRPITGKGDELDDDPPAKGVLLSGPPGTGKTLMAHACAAEINASFLKLDGPQLVQPDGSNFFFREAFKLAQENVPCIIFIDKIDAIATTRVTKNSQKTLGDLFFQLRELGHYDHVKVIATTNHADILHEDLIHAERLDRKIEIPLPTEEARADILQIHSREMNVNRDANFEELARSTDGFNGAQLKAVCVEADMLALLRDATEVHHEDFKEGIIQVQQAVKEASLNY